MIGQKAKIYFNEETENIPLPELPTYENILNSPIELEDINVGEGSKLGGIEAGAMNLSNHDTDDLPEGATHKYDDVVASGKANAGLDADGFVQKIINGGKISGDPLPGLNIHNEYIGYYDDDEWKVYIKSDGKFLFKGDDDNYITWQGSVLNIRGTLNADDINAGTLTGILVRTSESGQRVMMQSDRVEFYDVADTFVGAIDGQDDEVRVWGASGKGLTLMGSPISMAWNVYPIANNAYNLGVHSGNSWLEISAYYLYCDQLLARSTNISVLGNLRPGTTAVFKCGDHTDNYWSELAAHSVYYKTGNLIAFQTHDDLELMKNIKSGWTTHNKKKLKVWSRASLPKEILDEEGKFVNEGAIDGLLIGTFKQLIKKVETLDNRIIKLEKSNG